MEKEARIKDAINAVRKKQIRNITDAARIFEVPRSTVADRVHGRTPRVETRANCHKLTTAEEEALPTWLLDMDARGYPLTPSNIRSAALLLLQARHPSNEVAIGVNWISRYINRTERIQGKYTRRYDHQRAKCEDYALIMKWFNTVKKTQEFFGIQDCDTYNFDETGFALGVASTSRVVTSSDRQSKPKLIQPGDREWVTCIEAICADGYVLPPYVIFKGINYQQSWYETFPLPSDWAIGVSPKGWTTNEHGLN